MIDQDYTKALIALSVSVPVLIISWFSKRLITKIESRLTESEAKIASLQGLKNLVNELDSHKRTLKEVNLAVAAARSDSTKAVERVNLLDMQLSTISKDLDASQSRMEQKMKDMEERIGKTLDAKFEAQAVLAKTTNSYLQQIISLSSRDK